MKDNANSAPSEDVIVNDVDAGAADTVIRKLHPLPEFYPIMRLCIPGRAKSPDLLEVMSWSKISNDAKLSSNMCLYSF